MKCVRNEGGGAPLYRSLQGNELFVGATDPNQKEG